MGWQVKTIKSEYHRKILGQNTLNKVEKSNSLVLERWLVHLLNQMALPSIQNDLDEF
jgi:hypothetical protein